MKFTRAEWARANVAVDVVKYKVKGEEAEALSLKCPKCGVWCREAVLEDSPDGIMCDGCRWKKSR